MGTRINAPAAFSPEPAMRRDVPICTRDHRGLQRWQNCSVNLVTSVAKTTDPPRASVPIDARPDGHAVKRFGFDTIPNGYGYDGKTFS